MEAKLTLKLNDGAILRAKKYVLEKKTSLSSIVENFFDSLTLSKENEKFSYSPLVNELSGLIHLDADYDYKSDYAAYLEHKYE